MGEETTKNGEVIEIPLHLIIEPTEAMRTTFSEEKISSLAESIKQNGLINPITVQQRGDKYEIIAGHCRFLACCRVPLAKITAIVKSLSEESILYLRAHENLFRSDVDPVDEAIYIGKLIGNDESKIPEIAKHLNRSVQWVEDRLDILTYPEYFFPALKDGRIKLGVAKNLAKIEDDVYRTMFFNTAVTNGMTIWQSEYYLNQFLNGVLTPSGEILPPPDNANPDTPSLVKFPCAKCGTMAVDPNLTSVFIHRECPPQSQPPSET